MAPQTGFGFLVPDHYVLEDVTRNDIIIASLAWGFTIGFGWLTTWTALKQTKQMWRRHGSRTWRNAYIWMIWLEILVCLTFGFICFLYLLYIIPPSFEFYFIICKSSCASAHRVAYDPLLTWRCSNDLGAAGPIPAPDHCQPMRHPAYR